MRYFLFSAVFHLLLVFAGIKMTMENLVFQRVGDPTVNISMVGESSQISGKTEDVALGKTQVASQPKQRSEPVKKKVEKPVEVEKAKPIEKVVVEDVIEEPIPEETPEPLEEIHKTEVVEEEIIEEKSETPLEESEDTPKETDESLEPLENSNATETTNTSESSVSENILGEGLVQLEDGSVAAKNQGVKGLSYGFISQPEPNYPDIARRMGIREEVIIKVRFLIGYDGRVEDIKFYDNVENYGFRREVEKALRSWKATPIEVNGEKVKLYFYKSFKFERLN